MARMRMGSHSLDVEARRWGASRVDRSKRICKCCSLGKVEDELHFMLECPAYSEERRHLLESKGFEGHVPSSADNLRNVVNGEDYRSWKTLAQYIKVCSRKRSNMNIIQ